MSLSTPSFNISINGSYPDEYHTITPRTDQSFKDLNPFSDVKDNWSGFWSDFSWVSVGNYINYLRNPLNQVIDYYDSNTQYSRFFSYENTNYDPISQNFNVSILPDPNSNILYIQSPTAIQFTSSSILYFDISAIRKNFKTPHEFNLFYINLSGVNSPLSYGYLLYPNRIFLNPKTVSYNSSTKKWTFTTNVKIITSSTVNFFRSTNLEQDAFIAHTNYINNMPTLVDIPTNLNSNYLNFEIYANKTKTNRPIVNFTTGNEGSTTAILETDIAYLNPDTTFISYSASFIEITSNQRYALSQNKINDEYLNISQYFNPSYIVKHNPTVNNIQTFQLLQQAINNTTLLSDTNNCILSATVDNTGGIFNFYNNYAPADIKFPVGSYLGLNYIANCYLMQTTSQKASATLTGFTINGSSPTHYYDPQLVSGVSNTDIVWETTSPPHCYSYVVKLKDTSNTNYLDSNYLTFYVKTSAVNVSLTTATLSTFITCDFNALSYGFSRDSTVTGPGEQLSYKVISTSLSSIDEFLNSVNCTYGADNTPYDLRLSEFKDASLAKDLKINYVGTAFQGVSFTIQASLNTTSGQIDSFKPTYIKFAVPDSLTGSRLTINTLNEQSNSITVDSSFNVTTTNWPFRDLSNSNISWFFEPDNIPNVTITSVDNDGNYIQNLIPNQAIAFTDTSWRVKVEGYGAETLTIKLSSQKYNEVASVKTNPNLYNLIGSKLKVTPTYFNNADLTRTIKLQANAVFNDKTYDIPKNIPIHWTWEYDGDTDPDTQPIVATQILNSNRNYIYGSNVKSSLLSAIQLNVTPGYSKIKPTIHNVKAIVSTDITTPSISGYYQFDVDDFPDSSIFNADFATYYKNFTVDPSFQIANTRQDLNTVTRPTESDLDLTLVANSDIIPLIKNKTINWSFNDITIPNSTNTYDLDLSKFSLPTSVSYGIPVSSAKIALNINGIAPNWTSAHNVSSVTNFYILSSVDFYQPLKFIIYPEYAWIGPDSTHLTLLSTDPTLPTYFTNSYRPSAYANKISNSQTFWVSANKTCFTDYLYKNLQNYIITDTVSAYDLIDIQYNPYDTYISIGLPITLNAYNDTFYPENLPIEYKIKRTLLNGQFKLDTEYHTISSKTIPFIYSKTTDTLYDNFFYSPVILPYDYVVLNFTPNQTHIDLDVNNKISITQDFNTLPLNSPSVVISGTVTYYLSSRFWTVSAQVPAVNGTYNLFTLQLGDPAIPLNSGELGLDNFYLYAKTNIIQQIPASTFNNYSITQYPKNRNLWKTITV
jgi:hypothetical protein